MQNPSRPVTILVADDNPALLEGLERALVASGYRVETAADGVAVLKRLRASGTPPDLLLLDVMMPRATGIEVLAAVRRHRRLAGVPVILITAAIGDAFAAGVQRGGDIEVLVKPFRLGDLLARVEAHLARRVRIDALPPTPDPGMPAAHA